MFFLLLEGKVFELFVLGFDCIDSLVDRESVNSFQVGEDRVGDLRAKLLESICRDS